MTHIYISVHPVSHRLEWRGWGGGGGGGMVPRPPFEPPTTNAHTA